MRCSHLIYFAAALCPGFVSSLDAQVVIDSFNDGPFVLTGSSTSSVTDSQSASTSDIAGGKRTVFLNPEDNQFLPTSTISLQTGSGFLNYDREQNVAFQLKYGTYASTPMNLNLTGAGEDSFRLVLSQAPGPLVVTLQMRDNSFFVNEQAQSFSIGSGPGTYDIPFSAFPTLQFDKLGGILMTLWPGTAPDNGPGVYRFESFTAVPEARDSAFIFGAILMVFAAARGRVRGCPAKAGTVQSNDF
jgi:hypothetical protein